MSISQVLQNGLSGLSASQAGLATISQNVANANTVGYSRQTVSLEQRVINGINGCTRPNEQSCFITAHDARTGRELWRTHPSARPGAPGAAPCGDLTFEQRGGADVGSPGRWAPGVVERASLVPRDSPLHARWARGDTIEREAAGSRAGEASQALRAAGLFRDVRLEGVVERELENGETVVERFRVSARLVGVAPENAGGLE